MLVVKTYAFLVIAIIFEIVAVSALKSSNEFTRLWPTLLSLTCYCCSLFFLTLVLRSMSLGVTYAVWSGIGIVFVALVGVFYHKETLDLPAVIGILLILAGVVILNLYSNVVHSN